MRWHYSNSNRSGQDLREEYKSGLVWRWNKQFTVKSYIRACIFALMIAGDDRKEMIRGVAFVQVFFRKRIAAVRRFLLGIVTKGIGRFLFIV